MNSPTEEIKSRLDIVELIDSYVKLEKSGINFRARCPFHNEKTPSFFVSPARQIWHCFGGCGEGGDIFKFVMKIEGLDFPEALKLLARKAGVELKKEDPRIRSERNRLCDICEIASGWFFQERKKNESVNEYLKKRGLKNETVENFEIGFAPDSWRSLLNFLTERGFKPDEIERAGLAVRQQSTTRLVQARAERVDNRQSTSNYYDRFRNRIVFPISDTNGRVVGFGGRIFESQTNAENVQRDYESSLRSSAAAAVAAAKYINTPSTPIYDKSRILYGFDKAKLDIRKNDSVVIVEGYMDLVMSHQAGVKNAVAVSGTALTQWQLQNLKRLASVMISSFDADSAGETATKKSLNLAASFDFGRKVALIPSGKDPADAVLEDPNLWVKAVSEAKTVVEFYFDRAFKKFDKETAEGKKQIAAFLLPEIGKLNNEVEKAHWVSSLSRELKVNEDSIWNELRKIKAGGDFYMPQEAVSEKEAIPRKKLLEERLLSLLAFAPELSASINTNAYFVNFSSLDNEAAFKHLLESNKTGGSHAILAGMLDNFRFRGEVINTGLADTKDEFNKVIVEFERECLKERLSMISREISHAEEGRDDTKLKSLLGEFNELSARLSRN